MGETRVVSLAIFCAIVTASACHSQSIEDNIVLINVEDYDRGKIAKLISEINTQNPKVISLDLAFPEYLGDQNDKSLFQALQGGSKLVMPSKIYSHGEDYYGKEMITVGLACASEFFVMHAESGFVSAKIEEDQAKIPKQFIMWQRSYTGDIYYHFSVVTAMAFDTLKASRFIKRHERLVDINYKSGKRKFLVLSASEVLTGRASIRDMEGKIVMIGFLGPGEQDKFFTPFNPNPNEPDMYGLEYLAIIVAQVLENQE